MSLGDELKKEVAEILKEQWSFRDGQVVPNNDDLKLSNDGVKLQATVLYADLADSTGLVDTKTPGFSAEIYKSFLRCACKIITNNSGIITAFDGDRVMGVFIGDSKNSNAVKTALKINYAVRKIINPCIKNQYISTDFTATHGVGIDTSDLLVARSGIRGSNDLVWIGPAANYAAKLANLRKDNYSTWITENVFKNMLDEAKYSNGKLMWETRNWTKYNKTVYCSSYWWPV
jgi:class 3 adenylate cyclase